MTTTRVLFVSLALAACNATPRGEPAAEESVEPEREILRALADRGFDAPELTLGAASRGPSGIVNRRLALDGIPVAGMAVKTVDGVHHVPRIRMALAEPFLPRRLVWMQDEAVATALAALGEPAATLADVSLLWIPREELIAKPGAGPDANAADYERVITAMTLAYEVYLDVDITRWNVQIDAQTGEVIDLRRDELDVEYRTVTGMGYFAGTFTFPAEYVNNEYVLVDTHNNRFQKTTFPAATLPPETATYRSTTSSFGDGMLYAHSGANRSLRNEQTAVVDAWYAVNMTWEMLRTVVGRNGPDGTGGGLHVLLHERMANAYWVPRDWGRMLVIGYVSVSSGTNRWTPLTIVDIIGHELAHDMFHAEVCGGGGQNCVTKPSELAGINEASGDIYGVLAELYREAVLVNKTSIDGVPTPWSRFQIGEQTGTPVRLLYDPRYRTWFPGLGSETEHRASGPMSLMFLYLAYGCNSRLPACPGGIPISAIGPTAAARIWTRTIELLPLGAAYIDTRAAALIAAAGQDGYFGGPKTKAVAAAFAVINVGPPPDVTPPVTTFSCQQEVAGVRCRASVDPGPAGEGTFSALTEISLDGGAPQTFAGTVIDTLFPAASLSAGSHTFTLKAWDAWANRAETSVVVDVDKTGPTLSLTRAGAPKQPLLTASASDPAGIDRVELSVGGVSYGVDTTNPYSWTLDTSTWSDGVHVITVRAYDQLQNFATITDQLLVDNTAPLAQLSVGSGAPPFTIGASAVDASALDRAQLLLDGVPVALATGPEPYSFLYAPQDAATHTLTVAVTDAFGNAGTASKPAPKDLVPPVVTASVAQVGSTVEIRVDSADTCGLQTPYGLYVDGTLVATPSTPGYVLVLTQIAPGYHAFHALISDRCGNTTNFQQTFLVVANAPPTITAIAEDSSQPKKPKLTVTCVDPDDGVKHVEVRKDGAILQIDQTAPYEFVIDTSTWPDGESVLVFMCADHAGAASAAVNRTIVADNTVPSFGFSVYGAGRTYTVQATQVTDVHGIDSVVLTGGLATPSFTYTDTTAPYSYTWLIPGTFTIDTDVPFGATVKDKWGNTRSQAYLCRVKTSTTTPVDLSCVVWN